MSKAYRSDSAYISPADTATFLRAALRDAFPKVKFSVRTKTYSGGASINVSYLDGPPVEAVEAITEHFRGADFDGMIDLKSYRYHYLTTDGRLGYAGTHGTKASGGVFPAETRDMPEGARRVHLQADYIFIHRGFSTQARALIEARAAVWRAAKGVDALGRDTSGGFHIDGTFTIRAASEFDFTPCLSGGKPTLRPQLRPTPAA